MSVQVCCNCVNKYVLLSKRSPVTMSIVNLVLLVRLDKTDDVISGVEGDNPHLGELLPKLNLKYVKKIDEVDL